jgi:transcriptional regulator with XRE-family HTH domain
MDEISDKIRSLRKKNDLTLKEISEKTGLSISFLSQVENGTSSLAINSLKKIADALDVPINTFFENCQNYNFLTKSEKQFKFKLEGSNTEYILLSGKFAERSLEAMIIYIQPEQTHKQQFNHPGEEFIYVLEGALIVTIENKEYLAKAGDSIHYPSKLPHYWINPSKEQAKILTILTPLIF